MNVPLLPMVPVIVPVFVALPAFTKLVSIVPLLVSVPWFRSEALTDCKVPALLSVEAGETE